VGYSSVAEKYGLSSFV